MPGKIHVPIAVDVQGIEKVTKRLANVSKTIGGIAVAAAGLAAKFTVAFAGGAIGGARDLERNLAGLETVFGATTEQMVEFSKNATGMGLSLSEAAKASTFIGSVLKQSGFSIAETADLTEDLVTLGADLALTYGYDVQEALLGMTALFRGEYDPIEKFGVAMKQSEIDAEKLARGMGHLTGAAERFADQQIRVEFLMERAADAMGQVERQQASLAVQQNRLNATFNTMRDIVGMELTPVMAELAGAVADMLTRIMPRVQETFAEFEEPIRRIAFHLLPAIEEMLNQFLNFLSDVGEIINQATDPTSEMGDALQDARLAIDELFAGFERFGLEVPSFVEIVTGTVTALATAIENTAITIDDTITFVGAFVEALGKFDIWKMLWGDEAERRRFSNFISSAMYMRRESRDASREQKEATEDLLFTEDMLSRVQKQQADRYLDFLEKRGQAVKDVIKEEERLANLQTNIGDSIAKDLKEADVKDPVGDFFAKLEDEINKEAARLQLANFGLSEALVQQILGSADWEAIFDTIINGGMEAAEELQKAFGQTAAGIQEAAEAAQELQELLDELADLEAERAGVLEDYNEKVQEATASFNEFVEATKTVITGIDPLLTYERAIGKFEQATSRDLQQIENQLKSAFDNDYLLEEAYNNLRSYARREFDELLGIQRQRDELLAKRDAAADTIFGVAQAVAASANLTRLLGDVEDKVTEIEVSEVFEDIVKTAGSLEGFKVTLTRNFIDVVTETVNASNQLTSNFEKVIERTRSFIDNLETLRELGLDPFLFNQLVEAGAEAGGATAQALVDGGAETIAEVNRLQTELEAMGVELGEMTYEVTKKSGEQFVSGIVDGMDAELETLQQRALDFAMDFSQGFAAAVNAGMKNAFGSILDQIKSEFDKILAEIDAKIAEINRKMNQKITKGGAGTGITSVIIDPVTREAVNVGDVEIPQEEKDFLIASGFVPADFFGANGMMSTSASVTNNYDLTINSSASTGASMGAEVVNALKTWNATNGDYTISLTGFGS